VGILSPEFAEKDLLVVLHSQVLIFSLLALAVGYTGKPSTQTALTSSSPGFVTAHSTTVAVRDASTSSNSQWYIPASPQPSPSQQPSSPTSPTVKLHYRYYPITGVTASELRSQMSQKGVLDVHEGQRYDARTDWVVQWSYRYRRIGNQCLIQAPKTRVDVTLTYPQWRPPSGTSRSLITEWQQYLMALQHHEAGHQAHGIAAGKDILQALTQLPGYSSCQQLERVATASAQAVIRQYNGKDIAYDDATKHGYTQGANFPVTSTVLR
jgi:predicted secreted Zn-dependent protease